MSTVTIKLPENLIERVRELTANEGITVDQFIASAAAEKLSAFLTIDHLRRRAACAKRKDFEAFLNLSPEVPPMEND
jgi:hypothetical protein